MSISDDIQAIKKKYEPEGMKLQPSTYCKNTYAYSLGECARCGMCGREFDEEGNLIEEVDKDGI